MYDHNILNTPNGVFGFGLNMCSQLGVDGTNNIYKPTLLEFFQQPSMELLKSESFEIISIHYGYLHTLIRTTDGLFVMGTNNHGQLGLGDIFYEPTPKNLDFFNSRDLEIISIHCGDYHTIIHTTQGLFVFGSNECGQLGLGDQEHRYEPTKLEFFGDASKIISISCDSNHTITYTTDGLFVFGSNRYGQLGLGDTKNRCEPTKLEFFQQLPTKLLEILSIHCGGRHTIIHTTEGLFVFGFNKHGQLGLGDRKNRYEPTKLEFFQRDQEIISISCGSNYTIIYTLNGVFVFGDNNCGQLGLGDQVCRLQQTKLEFFQKHQEILSIYCGNEHTIVNTTDGLFAFGKNNCGQLGLGDTINRSTPTKLNFEYEIIITNNKRKIKSAFSHCF